MGGRSVVALKEVLTSIRNIEWILSIKGRSRPLLNYAFVLIIIEVVQGVNKDFVEKEMSLPL